MTTDPLTALHATLRAYADGNGILSPVASWLLPVLLAVQEQGARLSQLERTALETRFDIKAAVRRIEHHDTVVEQLQHVVMAHEGQAEKERT